MHLYFISSSLHLHEAFIFTLVLSYDSRSNAFFYPHYNSIRLSVATKYKHTEIPYLRFIILPLLFLLRLSQHCND